MPTAAAKAAAPRTLSQAKLAPSQPRLGPLASDQISNNVDPAAVANAAPRASLNHSTRRPTLLK